MRGQGMEAVSTITKVQDKGRSGMELKQQKAKFGEGS